MAYYTFCFHLFTKAVFLIQQILLVESTIEKYVTLADCFTIWKNQMFL